MIGGFFHYRGIDKNNFNICSQEAPNHAYEQFQKYRGNNNQNFDLKTIEEITEKQLVVL